jgi:hypothetical protein
MTDLPSSRESHDWLTSFLDYTRHAEAPPKLYFWVGIATIAGALRRRIWIDQAYFKWYPNIYLLLVAPPGVVAKSTTADLGVDLLRAVPGVQFGPDVVTWQALFDAFRDVHEGVTYAGEVLEMSALTISASEFGNFLRPDDREMVDQLVNIWDGKPVKKRTRMDGEQIIQNPCLNLIGCTTPSWIAGNFPEYLIGGGLTSRMVFVYAETKFQYVAYPFQKVPKNHGLKRDALVRDLERISLLLGEVTLSSDALEWGNEWYENFHKVESKKIDETLLGGYINRKQVLAHKVAMCIVASRGDRLIIEKEDLERSVALLTELERDMPKVYSRIGMSPEAVAGDQVLSFLKREGGKVPFITLYRYMHKLFPNPERFNEVVLGLKESGRLRVISDPTAGTFLELL